MKQIITLPFNPLIPKIRELHKICDKNDTSYGKAYFKTSQ